MERTKARPPILASEEYDMRRHDSMSWVTQCGRAVKGWGSVAMRGVRNNQDDKRAWLTQEGSHPTVRESRSWNMTMEICGGVLSACRKGWRATPSVTMAKE
jgi:hypothetical protein